MSEKVSQRESCVDLKIAPPVIKMFKKDMFLQSALKHTSCWAFGPEFLNRVPDFILTNTASPKSNPDHSRKPNFRTS